MSSTETVGIGIVLVAWATVLLVFNKSLSKAYREVWPNKFGSWNRDRGWHRWELLSVASIRLIVGALFLIRGLI
jgi:hypothetical protein